MKQRKYKTGIRRKVIRIMCLSTLIVMIMGSSMWYLIAMGMLRDMVGDVNRQMAQLLANRFTTIIDDEMARIKSYSENPLWQTASANSNSGFESMEKSAVTTHLRDMDAKWLAAPKGSPLTKEYLDSDVAVKLREAAGKDSNIAQIALFNKAGGLIAASEKAPFFYLTDEKLLKKVLSGNGGSHFIGDIEFDEALRSWVIPVAVPVMDADGSAVGVFRVELSVKKFFSSLGEFNVGKTGHAILINEKGNIIFHPGVVQLNARLYNPRDYTRLLTQGGKYAVIYEPDIHKKKMFVAFSEMMPPLLLENNMVWRILITQEENEVFAPLRKSIPWMLMALGILIAIMVIVGFVFSNVLVEPIEKLNIAAKEIMQENWDYPIDIKTGDEIEQFADIFKDMILDIKDKQTKLLEAKNNLEELSKGLEKKVQDRTTDLTIAKKKLDDYTYELEKALALKTDFISMASHELRTPLAAIKEGITIVLDQTAGFLNEQQTRFLDMSKKNVDRLSRFINDILDFQKLESGIMEFNKGENDINDVTREVKDAMSPLARAKGLDFIVELDENLPKIQFDKDMIMQVLTNLITNAIKFTEDGEIRLTTRRAGDNIIEVAVRDTGIGIKEEDMPKLFQKFSQIDAGLERQTGGTGLGLAISEQIIKRHQGKIWAESEPGKGSIFRFVLPIKERRA